MKLNYRTLGEGQALIILHGLFGSADNWQTLARAFAEHFKVYLVDLRNHGHSAFNEVMNYEVMCEDIKELMDDEHLQKATIIGHSMGGKVALFFAQTYPNRIDRLVVADMGLKKYPPHHGVLFDAMLSLDLERIKTRKEAEEFLKTKITDLGVLQFLLKNLYWSDKEQLAWRFNLHVLHRDIEHILSAIPPTKIDCETLFIRGEKSNYITDDDFASIAEQVPNAKFETIKGVGHWVHAEAPKEFLETTLNYLL